MAPAAVAQPFGLDGAMKGNNFGIATTGFGGAGGAGFMGQPAASQAQPDRKSVV